MAIASNLDDPGRLADLVASNLELKVDKAQHRISLSLKAALPKAAAAAPEEEEEEEAPAPPPRPRTTPLRGGVGDKTWLPGSKPE